MVSGRIAAVSFVQIEQAIGSGIEIGDFEALALQFAQVSSTALCSVCTVMMCLPLVASRNAPHP